MNNNAKNKMPLRALDKILRDTAESWWYLSLLFKFCIFFAGISLIFIPTFSQIIPFVVVIFTLIAEFSSWYYKSARDTYETLHRKLDFFDSLGWEISNTEISDLLTHISKSKKKKIFEINLDEPYFASDENVGPKKAVENIQESAWFSKHIAKRTGNIYLGIVIFIFVGSFLTLSISIETVTNFNVLTNMGRSATSALMLIFSLDLVRIAYSYQQFSEQSASIERNAQSLLLLPTIKMVDAIKIIQEYHLARADAPINPKWLWKIMRNNLNVIWQEYRKR